ncbi:MAG: hypothetical protein LUG95_04265 [Clostridiales bacterium]|nr:hypothetical protein [Clostridiales bacterium]
MIKSLKRKFIVISMFSVILVLSVIIGIINVANFYSVDKSNDVILDTLAENGGSFPEHNKRDLSNGRIFDNDIGKGFTEETPFETRYFTVILDSSGEVMEAKVDHIAAVTAESAGEMAQDVSKGSRESGYKGNYKYRITTDGNQTVCIFVDCSSALSNFKTFLFASVLVSLLGLLLIFVLIVFLSDKAIKPVAESYKKQKQFITDAGHELKTPITVISANAEVLEIENGENKWIDSIKNQVSKLSKLTQQLIDFSRLLKMRTKPFRWILLRM